MKIVVILFLAFVAVQCKQLKFPEEELAKHKKFQQECQDQTKVDPELIKKGYAGVFVDDEKLKAQMFCINKKFGSQNEDGTINVDGLRKRMQIQGDKDIDGIIKACAQNKASAEETAFELIKCWYSKTTLAQ